MDKVGNSKERCTFPMHVLEIRFRSLLHLLGLLIQKYKLDIKMRDFFWRKTEMPARFTSEENTRALCLFQQRKLRTHGIWSHKGRQIPYI